MEEIERRDIANMAIASRYLLGQSGRHPGVKALGQGMNESSPEERGKD